MKYVPNDGQRKNLIVLGEGYFTYEGSGPLDAVRATVSQGINIGVATTWKNLLKTIKEPIEGDISFMVTDVKELVPDQEYHVFLKFFKEK